jgi:hypothetical protein
MASISCFTSSLGLVGVAASGVVLLGGLAGCEMQAPEYQSEHALVITDHVDHVCAGTLARIDRTIESVDAQLGRETDAEPARIYIGNLDDMYDHCSQVVGGCVSYNRDVFLRWSSFDSVLVHEIVHERVMRTAARRSKALFVEGIAEALGVPSAPPDEDHEPPEVDAMLGEKGSPALVDINRGYYHAGELTAWLLDTHGMAKVLAFMAALDPNDRPKRIREIYTAHFGSRIDDDLFEHFREDEDLTPEALECGGPELARDPERLRFRLQAELDCDSPRVENQWSARDRAYVEWTIRISEADAGLWAPVRLENDGALPADTRLEVERCRREKRTRKIWLPSANRVLGLEPGLYRVRWHGPFDAGLELDLELGGPCDPSAQDCGVGERCINPGFCVPAK